MFTNGYNKRRSTKCNYLHFFLSFWCFSKDQKAQICQAVGKKEERTWCILSRPLWLSSNKQLQLFTYMNKTFSMLACVAGECREKFTPTFVFHFTENGLNWLEASCSFICRLLRRDCQKQALSGKNRNIHAEGNWPVLMKIIDKDLNFLITQWHSG